MPPSFPSPAANRPDDLQSVVLAKTRVRVGVFSNHVSVQGNGREIQFDVQPLEEIPDGQPLKSRHWFSVHHDRHNKKPAPETGADFGQAERTVIAPRSLRWHYPVQVRGVPELARFSVSLPPRMHVYLITSDGSALTILPERCYHPIHP